MNSSGQPQTATLQDRSIGRIIADANGLSVEQVEQILAYQKKHAVRFGEAAVSLGLAKGEDVMWALSQQFHYPYAADSDQALADELVVAKRPFSPEAEAFRSLRSRINMQLDTAAGARKAIAVTSPDRGEGRSHFAANLAAAFSHLGGRTLLVDADMRQPRQHQIFGIPNQAGLSGILSGRSETNVIQPVAGLPSLFVLPVGTVPPNPTELIERPAFGLLMRELLNKFDYVLVDTPAASQGSDYASITARCGAALVVARVNESKFDLTQQLVGGFVGTGAQVLGVVLNGH
jgi:protein-tyrosine kinase